MYFFALYYYFGLVKLPAKADYWHAKEEDFDILPESHPLANARDMTQDRFHYIFRFIHPSFGEEEDEADEGEHEEAEAGESEHEEAEASESEHEEASESEYEEAGESEHAEAGGSESEQELHIRQVEDWSKKVASFLNLLRDASQKICLRPA